MPVVPNGRMIVTAGAPTLTQRSCSTGSAGATAPCDCRCTAPRYAGRPTEAMIVSNACPVCGSTSGKQNDQIRRSTVCVLCHLSRSPVCAAPRQPNGPEDATARRCGRRAAAFPVEPYQTKGGATARRSRVLMVLGCARLAAPVLLSRTPITERNHAMHRVLRTVLTGLACATLVATASSALAQTGGEWLYYGGDQANTRYS